MALPPTDDEKAGMVLEIFRHYAARPKSVVLLGQMAAMAANKGFDTADVNAGLVICVNRGWVTMTPESNFQLTDDGFAAS